VAEYRREMDDLAFQRALAALWRLLAETNQYLVERQPWKVIKQEGGTPAVSRVLWNCLEAVRIVTVGLLPVMPKTAVRVLAALGVSALPESLDALAWGGLPNDVPLPEPEPIFPRIDKEAWVAEAEAEAGATTQKKATQEKTQTSKPTQPASVSAGETQKAESRDEEEKGAMIDIEQFFETELKVGTVKVAEPVPKSNKLLRLEVDLGEEEPRQLVAGIAKVYAPEALVGKQVVVVANLQPAKLMGVESRGMVLAASVDGEPVILHPDREVPPGTRVR